MTDLIKSVLAKMAAREQEMREHPGPLFLAWIAELETIMREWDSRYGNLPYTLPLADSTGLEPWRFFFDDEMSAREAFDADQQAWEE